MEESNKSEKPEENQSDTSEPEATGSRSSESETPEPEITESKSPESESRAPIIDTPSDKREKSGWPQAFAIVGAIALLVTGFIMYTNIVLSPEVKLQASKQAHLAAIAKLNSDFAKYIKSLNPIDQTIEIFSQVITEDFVKSNPKQASREWVYSGYLAKSLKLPVTYKYHVDANDKWEIDINGNVCWVTAPPLKVSSPILPTADQLLIKTDIGWQSPIKDKAASILKTITPIIQEQATLSLSQQQVNDLAISNLRKITKEWLLVNYDFQEPKFATVYVSFALPPALEQKKVKTVLPVTETKQNVEVIKKEATKVKTVGDKDIDPAQNKQKVQTQAKP